MILLVGIGVVGSSNYSNSSLLLLAVLVLVLVFVIVFVFVIVLVIVLVVLPCCFTRPPQLQLGRASNFSILVAVMVKLLLQYSRRCRWAHSARVLLYLLLETAVLLLWRDIEEEE